MRAKGLINVAKMAAISNGTRALAFALGSVLISSTAGQAVAAEDKYAAVRSKLEACFECHGENGVSDDPQMPILAGQNMYYTYVQLKDFQAGRRISPVMTEVLTGRTVEELFGGSSQSGRSDAPVMTDVAAFLTKEEMRAIATFFSEQAWPRTGYRADSARAGMGKSSTNSGQCVQCHLGGYEGSSGTPRLAGQYVGYLEKTMLDFKTKDRANAASKSSLMASYSADDIRNMAEFLAGM
jgi:cytochrome c553